MLLALATVKSEYDHALDRRWGLVCTNKCPAIAPLSRSEMCIIIISIIIIIIIIMASKLYW